jgi:hypothetical protein
LKAADDAASLSLPPEGLQGYTAYDNLKAFGGQGRAPEGRSFPHTFINFAD